MTIIDHQYLEQAISAQTLSKALGTYHSMVKGDEFIEIKAKKAFRIASHKAGWTNLFWSRSASIISFGDIPPLIQNNCSRKDSITKPND